jgi:hypothetical protein
MGAEPNSDIEDWTALERIAAALAAGADAPPAGRRPLDPLDALTQAVHVRNWWWVPLVAGVGLGLGSWSQKRWCAAVPLHRR